MAESLTVKQAARALGCSREKVIKLIKRGALDAIFESDPKAGAWSVGNFRYIISQESIDLLRQSRKETNNTMGMNNARAL